VSEGAALIPRHAFLLTDLEGAAGVTHWRQTRTGGGPEQEAARKLLSGEVNAAIASMREADPTIRVSVWDGHGTGGLDWALLSGADHVYRHDHPGSFPAVFEAATREPDPIDAVFFIGQHAMEGTGGNLAHTYSSTRVREHLLNGVAIGEFGTRALHAWAVNIPTVFFSGDDIACREAQELMPGLVAVEVKRSISVTEAECLTHEAACAAIAAGVARVMNGEVHEEGVTPRFQPDGPFEYREIKRAKWGLVPRPNRRHTGDDLADVLKRI